MILPARVRFIRALRSCASADSEVAAGRDGTESCNRDPERTLERRFVVHQPLFSFSLLSKALVIGLVFRQTFVR